ncbi:MAG TPA: acyltransferase [Kofleriaceae bacterium]|nr:acyltransferase [Kofleriaceae bacterium]
MGTGDGEARRIGSFDGLRACAFGAVYLCHAIHLPYGFLGVDLFFVLSGFLITRNLLALRDRATTASALAAFYYRRVLRIVPPCYLALVVMVLLWPFPLHETPWYVGFASNIRDSIYPVLQGPMDTMWSIAVEEQFYLLWPFFVLLLPRRALAPAFWAAVVFASVFRVSVAGNDDAVYRLMFSRMDLLAAGALLALVDVHDAQWIGRHRRGFAWALAIAAPAYALCALIVPGFRFGALEQPGRLGAFLPHALAAIAMPSLLALVRTGTLEAVLCVPVLRYVGKVSYTCYLVHYLVILRVHELHLPGVVAIALGLALTIGFATLSWYVVEQPLARLRGRVRVVPAC